MIANSLLTVRELILTERLGPKTLSSYLIRELETWERQPDLLVLPFSEHMINVTKKIEEKLWVREHIVRVTSHDCHALKKALKHHCLPGAMHYEVAFPALALAFFLPENKSVLPAALAQFTKPLAIDLVAQVVNHFFDTWDAEESDLWPFEGSKEELVTLSKLVLQKYPLEAHYLCSLIGQQYIWKKEVRWGELRQDEYERAKRRGSQYRLREPHDARPPFDDAWQPFSDLWGEFHRRGEALYEWPLDTWLKLSAINFGKRALKIIESNSLKPEEHGSWATQLKKEIKEANGHPIRFFYPGLLLTGVLCIIHELGTLLPYELHCQIERSCIERSITKQEERRE